MAIDEIIVIKNKKQWDSTINKMIKYDFYHTYTYNHYYSKKDEIPVLFLYKYDIYEIAIPLIIRKIDYSSYYDVTSCYGYGGPIASSLMIPTKIIQSFCFRLSEYFLKNNIISVFSRLHPCLNNDFLISNIGKVEQLGNTVYIDLTKSSDIQKKEYKKGTKSDLSKLKKDNYIIFEDTNFQYIDEFINIYNENMVRVNAKKDYFFNKEYYELFTNNDEIKSKLYFVIKDNIKIAASIFVFTNDIIQYHLSATKTDFLKNSPVRLLIDYVREVGTSQGYKELHLGGGVGSAEDSLFSFKAGFSCERHVFKVWKYIVNQEIYDDLVLNKCNNNIASNYFPAYRAINL